MYVTIIDRFVLPKIFIKAELTAVIADTYFFNYKNGVGNQILLPK